MTKQDPKVSALVREARRLGATEARPISTEDIFLDERVRLKCLAPLCRNYGRHLLCPPGLMTFCEFRSVLSKYRRAILVQLESDADSTDRAASRIDGKLVSRLERTAGAHRTEKRLHAIINDLEASAFKSGFYLAAGLIGSECLLCRECVGISSGQACRHPFRARPSMQALGIDVIRTTRKAGVPVALSSKSKVKWTGLLLLD